MGMVRKGHDAISEIESLFYQRCLWDWGLCAYLVGIFNSNLSRSFVVEHKLEVSMVKLQQSTVSFEFDHTV